MWFCSGVDCEAIEQAGSKSLPVNEQSLLSFLNILHPINLNLLSDSCAFWDFCGLNACNLVKYHASNQHMTYGGVLRGVMTEHGV